MESWRVEEREEGRESLRETQTFGVGGEGERESWKREAETSKKKKSTTRAYLVYSYHGNKSIIN